MCWLVSQNKLYHRATEKPRNNWTSWNKKQKYVSYSYLFNFFIFIFVFIFILLHFCVIFFKYFYSNFSAWVPRFTYVVKFLLLFEDFSILILNFCYSRYPGEQEEWTMIAAMSVYSRLVIFFLYYHFQSQFFVRGYQFLYILILSSLFIIVLFTSISVYRCWPMGQLAAPAAEAGHT